ncbi:hypothetical protein Tco_0024113 [Tanacetum coccineum]
MSRSFSVGSGGALSRKRTVVYTDTPILSGFGLGPLVTEWPDHYGFSDTLYVHQVPPHSRWVFPIPRAAENGQDLNPFSSVQQAKASQRIIFRSMFVVPIGGRKALPGSASPEDEASEFHPCRQLLNEKSRNPIRKYLENTSILVVLSRTYVVSTTFQMGLLDFVRALDPFKVKVGERTLAENEVPLVTKIEDRVVSPSSQTICLVDHTIQDELNVNSSCTDISKITRKPSKTGKHGLEERKSTKEAKDSKPKPSKVTWSNYQSTH